MVAWDGPGRVCGLVRDTGFGPGSEEPHRLLFSPNAYTLSSPGTVDLQGATRFEYSVADVTKMHASATLSYDADDVTDATQFGVTAPMGAVMLVAPGYAFAPGVVPTPLQIEANALIVAGGRDEFGVLQTRTTPGDLTMVFDSGVGSWSPNSKWWFLVLPCYYVAPEPVTAATAVALGDGNTNGRAISLWTNRTPAAPVITSPIQNVTFSGSTATLAYRSGDPDRFISYPGDAYPYSFADVAGAQIQYASANDPIPVWEDLPIVSVDGASMGRGWYISAADAQAGIAAANDGGERFWTTGQIQIQCGGDPIPRAGYLPVGEWQVRMRTFDYGHPVSTGTLSDPDGSLPPLTDTSGDYTPDTYPADNTSPWSVSVFVSAAAQVLPPVPLSPKDNAAVDEGSPVTLIWKYRNTYVPPYAQATRTVQIRQVGETSWTPLITADASASPSYLVTGYDFVSGNRYEWRVMVTDADGESSDWSDAARFWVIPEPASGDVIPPAGEIIEGAALGCGKHRAFIFRRGGRERVGEITDVSYLDWDRVRDDISTSKIDVTGWGIDCGNLLAMLQPWAYEIVIFRDNGFSVDRVWEGPITLLTYERDRVVIHAKDVIAYAYRRIIKQAMSDAGNSPTAGASVVNRAMRVIQNVFAPDDPNVLAYLQVLDNVDDAKQYRSTPAYSRTAYEEVDDMAANAGLDYTAVGRAILLWGTKHRIGTLPEFRDKDLGSSPIVSVYGMSFANLYAISDGNGVHGEATRLNEDGEDPTYGLVEMLSSTWASDAEDEAGTYTEEGLETIRQSFADAAERSISDRYPPPVVVRVPDNTTVNPDTVLSIQHLVPGVVVPLRSTGTLRTVVATQKLDSVKVVEQGGTETITITLSPFSRDDVEAPEGEG